MGGPDSDSSHLLSRSKTAGTLLRLSRRLHICRAIQKASPVVEAEHGLGESQRIQPGGLMTPMPISRARARKYSCLSPNLESKPHLLSSSDDGEANSNMDQSLFVLNRSQASLTSTDDIDTPSQPRNDSLTPPSSKITSYFSWGKKTRGPGVSRETSMGSFVEEPDSMDGSTQHGGPGVTVPPSSTEVTAKKTNPFRKMTKKFTTRNTPSRGMTRDSQSTVTPSITPSEVSSTDAD